MDSNEIGNSIEWDKKVHNFGEINIGQTRSATFIYYGNKEIKSFNSSCFCLSIRSIKYLDRTEVVIFWKVNKTPKVNKVSKKTVDVIFDDEEVTLTLYGTIKL